MGLGVGTRSDGFSGWTVPRGRGTLRDMRTLVPIAMLALLVGTAAAADPTPVPGEEPVHVYTNADLERYGTQGTAEAVAAPAPMSFEEVEAYLGRAWARVDAERAVALDRYRARAERDLAEARLLEARRPQYVLPWAFARPLVPAVPYRTPRADVGRPASAPPGAPAIDRRPLYARPPAAVALMDSLKNVSGADSVPKR